MVIFSMNAFLDEQACYDALLTLLHPDGLKCPNDPPLPEGQAPQDRHRAPIYDCRCRECGTIYNLFTGTRLSGSHYSCSTWALLFNWALLLKGIAEGTPTRHLAREAQVSYRNLLRRRQQLQSLLELLFPPSVPLSDRVTEADEMFQNAGEKGERHARSDDPPRRRANKKRGHGTYETDRPPIAGVFGRESGQVRLEVLERTDQKRLLPFVEGATRPNATVNTDEWKA